MSPEFRERVWGMADRFDLSPDDIMTCIAWETGRTFSPSVKNMAGSGAVGLIQFMPQTAVGLGTSSAALAAMTAVQQLEYVERYFRPWRGRLRDLADLYMAILWPAAVGKPDNYVLFDRKRRPTAYRQNAGLDLDRNGAVTREECVFKLRSTRSTGLLPGNIG